MTKNPKNISIANYTYDLPDGYIAEHPLPERDRSRLLVASDGKISEDVFLNIDKHLPSDSLLVYNDTRVVQARLIFFKTTGARIEIFCIDPAGDGKDIQVALGQTGSVEWNCMVGNAKKWKGAELIMQGVNNSFLLKALLVGTTGEYRQIKFSWEPAYLSFAEILEMAGKTPLPPYITREPEEEDKGRYQTIYAANKGSVAAPTAGLHFTDNVFQKLKGKKIDNVRLTLHVGAGTFKPVSSNTIGEHNMHAEEIVVSEGALQKLKSSAGKNIVSVGTTSLRTLETIYWWGVKLLNNELPTDGFFKLSQWYPYEFEKPLPSLIESIDALLNYLKEMRLGSLRGNTELIIVPSYKFKTAKMLITNFHQSQSTLLLLVAAFLGDDWKKAYDYAIDEKFRFLSYGDSCLFFRKKQ